MTYCIYHIPGKKIGVTSNLEERVTRQQGYTEDEYEVLDMSDDISYISHREIELQKMFGYRVDQKLYKDLKPKNEQLNYMKINVTEQTTTFPCPINKLKGRLMDNTGMTWETEHGNCTITDESIKWIMKNVQTSKYNTERCYVYNKAFVRYFDNNDPYNGKTITGALAPDCGVHDKQLNIQEAIDGGSEECCDYLGVCECAVFDDIRIWAEERGLYDKGDPKTQALKLVEEVGETCRAILKQDEPEIVDGIGDCVVVLTNLAHLCDTSIEECTRNAYNEIKNRKGRMDNGTFKKD